MNESNYCELCNTLSTQDNPVKWNYDLQALACSECVEEFYSFSDGSEEDEGS